MRSTSLSRNPWGRHAAGPYSQLQAVSCVSQSLTRYGDEERFSPPRLSADYGFGKETIARMRRNGRDAPIPAAREAAVEPQGSTESCRSPPARPHPPATQGDVTRMREPGQGPDGCGDGIVFVH